jgi:hypothetical protein
MATITWIGAISTSANNASNWLPPIAVPAAGDVALFDSPAAGNCIWDIPVPGGTALSVDEIIVESGFGQTLSFNTYPRIKGLYLDGTLTTGGGVDRIDFQIGSSPNFYGTYKSYNERFILLGSNANATGFQFNLTGDATQSTKFDDGPHPTVTLEAGKFAPDYVVPTSTSGKASFTSFFTKTDFAPDGDLVDNDRLKVFSMEAFPTPTSALLNFGLATVEYYATSGGFYIPTEKATGYPTDFTAYHRKIVLKANTAGHKCLIADNTFISVEEFEIGDGVVLKGPVDATSQGADIRSIQTPKIRGTWSFSQISQGIYRSPRHASGPMPKVNGNFHITGKLDVDGLIDPTGLELNPVGSNPGGVTANTLWLNSGDNNKLYHGSSEVGSGSGSQGPAGPAGPAGQDGADGSDGADGADGSDGADGNSINISALPANTAIADADLLLLDDGANGTNRKTTFDQVAQWIRGGGVMVGRNGGVNKLRIRDSRDDGQLTPDDWGNKQVSFDFTDQYNSLLPSAYWANVITLKGWTDSYRVAQLMTSATSEGTNQSNKDTEPLYFRSGEDSGWGAMREILTFPIGASGSTPNADGAAGQILQTNGAGTLSWVDGPAGLEYEKYTLGDTIPSSGSIANGVTTQLTFGSSGATLVPTYGTTLTSWGVNLAGTHIDILQDGLYHFNFVAFLASLGTSQADYRVKISSTSSLTGDLLSFRSRTAYIDRYTSNGATTVYLTTGDTVYFSVYKGGGNTYEVGGTIVGPEVRTFLDVRRIG